MIEENALTNVFQMLTERISKIEYLLEQQQKAISQIDEKVTNSFFHHFGQFPGTLFGLPFEIEYEHGWCGKKPLWAPGFHQAMVVQLDENLIFFEQDGFNKIEDIDKVEIIHNRCNPSTDIWLWSRLSKTPAWFAEKAWTMCKVVDPKKLDKVTCIGIDEPDNVFSLDEIILKFFKVEAQHHKEWLIDHSKDKKSFLNNFVQTHAQHKMEIESLIHILKNHELTSFYCNGYLE